jgi:hypothetical protein
MTYVTEETPVEKMWAPYVAQFGEWSDEALQRSVDATNKLFKTLTPDEGTIFKIDVSERVGAGFDKLHECLNIAKPTEEVVLEDLFAIVQKRI